MIWFWWFLDIEFILFYVALGVSADGDDGEGSSEAPNSKKQKLSDSADAGSKSDGGKGIAKLLLSIAHNGLISIQSQWCVVIKD